MLIRFGRSGGPVPVDGRAPTGHDETVLTVPSPGKDCEFWVTMKQSRWRAKNKAPRVGRQPY